MPSNGRRGVGAACQAVCQAAREFHERRFLPAWDRAASRLMRGPRWDPEDAVRQAASLGTRVDLGTRRRRDVRAELLVALLTTGLEGTRGPRAIKLAGARIVGALDLEAATLLCPLSLEVCEFTGTVTFSEAHAPAIRLINCQLGNLHADQLETRGTLDLSFSTATAEVRLSGAHIGGALNLDGAKLLNDWTEALIADGIRVDQDMSLDRNFVARGGVRLIGAHIGGSLLFHGAELTGAKEDGNRFGPALSADRLRVDQLLNLGVVTKGEARLAGAQIGGPLVLDEAKLTNESGPALSAERLHVDQDVFCRAKFSAKGEVRLVGAHIGGQVSFDGATLRGDGTTLDLSGAQTESAVLRFAKRPAGAVNLRAAKLGWLFDRTYGCDAKWPDVRLVNCSYDALHASSKVDAKQRLEWLGRDPDGYAPQPYQQLADVYRRSGDDEAARQVLIAKQRRRQEDLGWPAKWWSWFLGLTVGYGYRLWLAGVWLIVLAVTGSLLFGEVFDAVANGSGDLTPAKAADQVAPFQPVLYTVDVLLPVVSLAGQETGWNANGAAQWVTAIGTLAGWLLSTALVAGLVIRSQ